MSKPIKQADAHKWMLQGIEQHENFVGCFRQAKDFALNAGLFFMSAKDRVDHGNWENFISGYTHKIAARTIRFYMDFTGKVIEWVKAEQPKLLGMDEISAAARTMVLQSPKGLVALCRELKLMRKFGEYDAVKYRANQIKGDNQIEFNFNNAKKALETIGNPRVKLPQDLPTAEKLAGMLKSAWERAEQNVREVKQTIEMV